MQMFEEPKPRTSSVPAQRPVAVANKNATEMPPLKSNQVLRDSVKSSLHSRNLIAGLASERLAGDVRKANHHISELSSHDEKRAAKVASGANQRITEQEMATSLQKQAYVRRPWKNVTASNAVASSGDDYGEHASGALAKRKRFIADFLNTSSSTDNPIMNIAGGRRSGSKPGNPLDTRNPSSPAHSNTYLDSEVGNSTKTSIDLKRYNTTTVAQPRGGRLQRALQVQT